MYRIKPYVSSIRNRDVFDLFDDFFTERKATVGNFKIDVKDENDKYIVEAELPGLSKEDVNIKFENDYLTISVHKEENKEDNKDTKYVFKERYTIDAERRMYIPDVDPTKLSAKMEQGILIITLNKSEQANNSYLIDIE